MKYTDGLFEFPVRIYDGVSLRKAQKSEEDLEVAVDGDWVAGSVEIPFNEIKGLIDYFSKGRSVEDVHDTGFDCCIVMTNSFGDFICTLPKRKFKDRLNAFADKYANVVEEMVDEELKLKQLAPPQPASKPSFWRTFSRRWLKFRR